jgi:peptide/nickel transport system permease protein
MARPDDLAAPSTAVPRPRFGFGLYRLGANRRLLLVACAILALIAIGAVFAPWLTPYGEQGRGVPDVAEKLEAPSLEHPLGTDELGRDLLARLLYGARTSLAIAACVVLMGVLIGVPIGALAGYLGRRVDELAMRITDVFLAFPPVLLAIVIAAALGPSLWNVILALGITWWPWYARLARAQAVSLRARPFVEAAEVIGVRRRAILRSHIIRNLYTPISVQATLDLAAVILLGAGLSFLGLGVEPPTADWGAMVSAGRVYFPTYWWYVTFPGLAIFLTSLCFVIVGDTFREALDPRRRAGLL